MKLARIISICAVGALASAPTAAATGILVENEDASLHPILSPPTINPQPLATIFIGNEDASLNPVLGPPTLNPQPLTDIFVGNSDAVLRTSLQLSPFTPSVNYEELLAERFRPILYLHEDERFQPQEIQVVLDTAVLLKGDSPVSDAPSPLTKEFLSTKTDSDYKLDLRGNTVIEGPEDNPYKNTAYAHIVEDEGHIVLQYWFFYYYNPWPGAPLGVDSFDHEGDWEFIQLIFPDSKTVQEIIEESIAPNEAIYSAHLGGYRENWSSDAVEKDGERPIVYVAKGSHANYFQKGVCDVTPPRGIGVDEMRPQSDPLEILNSQPILDPVNNTEFKWLLFGGKWGNDGNSPPSPLRQDSWSGDRARTTDWMSFYLDHCDGDFDGVWNNIDTEPETFSNEFSAPNPLFGRTDGKITERGDREFRIKNSAIGGIHLTITPGEEAAVIDLDGRFCFPESTIVFKPSADRTLGIATCLSSQLEVEEGSADFTTSHDGIEVVATVSASQTVHYDIIDDKLHTETSGEGEIPLTINGRKTTIQAGQTFSVIEVLIDIKPGSDRNPINCKVKGNGVIPVAILSTEDFDATTVDHSTVVFEGATETHIHKKTGEAQRHEEDVNKDGKLDLMFHFRQNETSLACESTEATLTGKTFDGDLLIGTDSIDTKPN